jgi:two-component system, cell cycle response regulator DivK
VSKPSRILVVEDNEANQMLTRAVLELEGFEVEVAGSAPEALEQIRQRRPDMILMDVQLPGQDGLSLTRQLKRDPAYATIPVVALTAHAMQGDREIAMGAGCVGYIAKPIDTRTFGAAVSRLLGPADGDLRVAAQ